MNSSATFWAWQCQQSAAVHCGGRHKEFCFPDLFAVKRNGPKPSPVHALKAGYGMRLANDGTARFRRVGLCLHQSLPPRPCQQPMGSWTAVSSGKVVGGPAQRLPAHRVHAIVGQSTLPPRPAHLRKGTCLNAACNAAAFVLGVRAHPSVCIGAHAGKGCPIVGAGLCKFCCVAVLPKPHMVKWLQANKQTHAWLRKLIGGKIHTSLLKI